MTDEDTGEAFLLSDSKGELLVGEGDLELLLVKEQSLASPTEPSLFGGQLLLLLLWGRGCSCTCPPPPWFCIRQWILNQLDLLPYLEPDLDMPTMRHFLSLQALQAVLFFLSTTHLKLFLHSWITDWLLQVLPKKLLQPSQVNAPKWKPAAGSSHTRHCWFCIGSIFSSCNDGS